MCPSGCCWLYCGSKTCSAPTRRGGHSRWSSVLCWWPSGTLSFSGQYSWQTTLRCSMSAHFPSSICKRTPKRTPAAPLLGRFSAPSRSGVSAVLSWSASWCWFSRLGHCSGASAETWSYRHSLHIPIDVYGLRVRSVSPEVHYNLFYFCGVEDQVVIASPSVMSPATVVLSVNFMIVLPGWVGVQPCI